MLLEDYRNERLKKLNTLREQGIDPYPAKSYRNTKISDILNHFDEKNEQEVVVAGRVTAIRSFVKLANVEINETSGKSTVKAAYDLMDKLCYILGIITEKKEESLDAEVEALIAQRQEARKNKDFAKADEIRDKLQAMGIVLKDTREGVKWERA